MYYNVAQLLKEAIGSIRTHDVREHFPVDGINMVTANGNITLARTHSGIWCTGNLMCDIETNCSRCLNSMNYTIRIYMDEEYCPTIDILSGKSLRNVESIDNAFVIDDRHELNLTEGLRQCVISGQVMKPLCQPNCLGLCPNCGIDMNEMRCSCYNVVSGAKNTNISTIEGLNNN